MAIAKMMLVRASGKMDELNNFINACRASGEFHPENASQYLSGSLGFESLNEENPYTDLIQKIEEISAISGASLKADPLDHGISIDRKAKEYIAEISDNLNKLHEDRKILTEQLKFCEDGIVQFSHFTGLEAEVQELFSCEFVDVRFGHLPKDCYEKLRFYDDNPYLFFIPCSTDKANYWGVYFAPCDRINEIDRIFASLYFERLKIPGAVGTAKDIIKQLNNNIEIIKSQLADLDNRITSYWLEHEKRYSEIYSTLKWLNDTFDIRSYAVQHENQFYFVCWIPQNSIKIFEKNTKELTEVSCEISDANQSVKVQPPVKLKNNFLFRPFEMFVSMYGLPSYKGVDITAFVAITYTVLFGIMFGDLGQGFVLMLAGILMWKRKGISLGKILIPCGISSMFFGFLFGSVFGYEELLNPVYHAIGLEKKPLEVMGSINTVLLFAIGIGVALVIASMFINVYVRMKNKQFGEALFSNNGITGIFLYIAGVCAVVGFMGGRQFIPSSVIIIIFSVTAVILFFKEILIGIVDHHEHWKPESMADFILQNLFEMLEYVLSYFSNTVSFLRIGAFVLVHAGMMMVVFSLAGKSENIIVIILGNVLVICLEGLLTGIQALRLEFYEMFSRCFDGEGRPFTVAVEAVENKN